MQDVVDQQMEAVLYAAQLLRRICLVQGDQLGVVFQLPQQVIAHGIVTGQIQRCTTAEIGLIVKILCPRLGLGRMVKVVVVRLPQVQEKERVRSIHCVFAQPRKHTAEAAVDLIRKQLGAAAALCNIAVILLKEPAEALAHKLHLCIAQHQVLQTADRLQRRIVQRLLCLLHCIAEHDGKVTVIYIPVYAKAVHRAPDRTLIRRRAAFAVLDVLCKNSIEIFRVQTNSSYKKSAFLL